MNNRNVRKYLLKYLVEYFNGECSLDETMDKIVNYINELYEQSIKRLSIPSTEITEEDIRKEVRLIINDIINK